MKVITWNTNSRAKEETLNKQCLFLDNQFDIITLQEITLKSQDYFKNFFQISPAKKRAPGLPCRRTGALSLKTGGFAAATLVDEVEDRLNYNLG